jgi:F0F1-type ATP synthase assembly protein I
VPAASPPALTSQEERRERSTAAKFAGAGLQFGVTILASLWLGTWIDRKFGTAPVFLYVAVFLGAGAAFYSMYRQLMANLERDEQAKRAQRGSAGDAASRESGERGERGDRPRGSV